MTQKNSGPEAAEDKTKSTPNSSTTKHDRILGILQSGHSLNMFEAEHLGDHVLRSTISELRRQGHLITDEWELVPTRFGRPARVKRYRYVPITQRTAEVEDALALMEAAS